MPFDPKRLCVLSYARAHAQPKGFTHWFYWSEEPWTLLAPGFFDAAADDLRPGDVIFATGTGGTLQLAVVAVREGRPVPGELRRTGSAVSVQAMAAALPSSGASPANLPAAG